MTRPRSELSVAECLDAIPQAVNLRGAELANQYAMSVTVAASVGLVLAELWREGLIEWNAR